MATATLAVAAVIADWLLGEPRRWHPLVGFGRLAERIEQALHRGSGASPLAHRSLGLLAVVASILPLTLLAALVTGPAGSGDLIGLLLLYFALGHRSLHQHALRVMHAAQRGDDADARRCAGLMVSRDPEAMDVAAATIESVLENASDGVFATLFWFVVAGAAGAVLHRLSNTLDATWGYRNERYLHFGWAAARLDDLLNFVPARLTALTFALSGQTRQALACWRVQACCWASPNAGAVMAAGAGALGLRLGGPARYHGAWHPRPVLGCDSRPTTRDIERALGLVQRGVWLWLAVLVLIGMATDA